MSKAKLTGRQGVAAVFAGIFGHLLFAAGWIALGVTLLGGIVTAVLGGAITSLGGMLNKEGLDAVFDKTGAVFGNVLIILIIVSVVLIVIAFVVSGLILRGGKVRKPWGTTWTAILISAVLDVPLLLLYALIAGNTEGPSFLIIALIGTLVFGILVWLWMTWAHRGSGSQFANASVTGASGQSKPVETDTDTPAIKE